MKKTVVRKITENYKQMDYIHFGFWLEENIQPLLDEEKRQIINAHEDGFFRDDDEVEGTTLRSMDELRMEANEYFDKQYKNASK